MYLHAGNNKIIRTKSIIGIFDMDNATLGADTRAFLKKKEPKKTYKFFTKRFGGSEPFLKRF